MKRDDRFDAVDKAALYDALLRLKTCPHCRADLAPVAFLDKVYACPEAANKNCRKPFETWHIPEVS